MPRTDPQNIRTTSSHQFANHCRANADIPSHIGEEVQQIELATYGKQSSAQVHKCEPPLATVPKGKWSCRH